MINNLRAKSKYDNSLGTNYVPLTKKKKRKRKGTPTCKKKEGQVRNSNEIIGCHFPKLPGLLMTRIPFWGFI